VPGRKRRGRGVGEQRLNGKRYKRTRATPYHTYCFGEDASRDNFHTEKREEDIPPLTPAFYAKKKQQQEYRNRHIYEIAGKYHEKPVGVYRPSDRIQCVKNSFIYTDHTLHTATFTCGYTKGDPRNAIASRLGPEGAGAWHTPPYVEDR